MAVQRHEEQQPQRPSWAWGELPPPPPPPVAPVEPVAPVAPPQEPPQRPVPAPVYVVARPPTDPSLLARAVARARAGAAGAVPVDRTAARIQRVLVMAILGGGWGLSLSDRRFAAALPLAALALLVAAAQPALSLPRLISARVLTATGLAGPWYTAEDPAPHRLGEAAAGVVLAAASVLALAGVTAVAWGLAWAVVLVSLVEFTFDTPAGAMLGSRRRRARPLRA
ncbi:MAG TPA: DUF4395 family protein [Candidatus Dormibacteraeota bacterium]|nr:DUF4395 family protein [Candidatus Dormibacteraeota bacterium]